MIRILVIDDDEATLKVLTRSLEIEGYQVDQAMNGAEGLALFDSIKPDLVITDIVMPVKDGLETILELVKKRPEIPVIAISGGGRISKERYLELASYLGNTRTLAKPFSREELISTVKEQLAINSLPDSDEP